MKFSKYLLLTAGLFASSSYALTMADYYKASGCYPVYDRVTASVKFSGQDSDQILTCITADDLKDLPQPTLKHHAVNRGISVINGASFSGDFDGDWYAQFAISGRLGAPKLVSDEEFDLQMAEYNAKVAAGTVVKSAENAPNIITSGSAGEFGSIQFIGSLPTNEAQVMVARRQQGEFFLNVYSRDPETGVERYNESFYVDGKLHSVETGTPDSKLEISDEQLQNFYYPLVEAYIKKWKETEQYTFATRPVAAGENVAFNSEVTATSVYGDYVPENAVDGNFTENESRWLAAPNESGEANSITLNMGREYLINEIKFWNGYDDVTDPYSGKHQLLQNYTIEYSNIGDREWTPLAVKAQDDQVQLSADGEVTIQFDTVLADYIRLSSTDFTRIYEIQVIAAEDQ